MKKEVEEREEEKTSLLDWLYLNSEEIFTAIGMLLGIALVVLLVAFAIGVFVKVGTMT